MPGPSSPSQPRALPPEPISIEDYTSNSTQNIWAIDVGISGYEIIGNSHVVYHVVLKTKAGTRVSLYKRYSEFYDLRVALVLAKPLEFVPQLPRKSIFVKFEPRFLEQRRKGLDYFIKCVTLNSNLSCTKLVRDFFI